MLISYLLLETMRLLRVPNDERLALIRAISVALRATVTQVSLFFDPFRLSPSDGLVGRKTVEKPCFIHVEEVC